MRNEIKNKLIPVAASLVLLVSSISTASAGLIDRGNGMIYDDDLNITWLTDANYAVTSGYAVTNAVNNGSVATDNIFSNGRMGWDAAITWADNLVFGGFDDWRLFNSDLSCDSAYNCSINELGHLNYIELGMAAGFSMLTSTDVDFALFSNVQAGNYWSSMEGVNTTGALFFSTSFGLQSPTSKANEAYAWAVRSGDVAAVTAVKVPEPGTMLLLAAGLAGVVGIRRRRCLQEGKLAA